LFGHALSIVGDLNIQLDRRTVVLNIQFQLPGETP
jgi:hypothetical protein